MGRRWPALDLDHRAGPSQDLLLAELDSFQPTAIQELEEPSRLRAFFATSHARDAAARELASRFGSQLAIGPVDIEDDDWAARSQAQLCAVTVGRIVVAPPWDVAHADSTVTTVVVIRPSMGFGTGHHATTRLVLRALQELRVQGRTVLDIGCGSGVLTLAATKLGARMATGIDIDPDALVNARENLDLNGPLELRRRIRFEQADLREIDGRADIVLANLTGTLIEKSAQRLTDLLEVNGDLVVSGFMSEETPRVVAALEPLVSIHRMDEEDTWMCATCSTLAPDVTQNGERRGGRGVGP